jgi:hypothetical protein
VMLAISESSAILIALAVASFGLVVLVALLYEAQNRRIHSMRSLMKSADLSAAENFMQKGEFPESELIADAQLSVARLADARSWPRRLWSGAAEPQRWSEVLLGELAPASNIMAVLAEVLSHYEKLVTPLRPVPVEAIDGHAETIVFGLLAQMQSVRRAEQELRAEISKARASLESGPFA